MSRDAATTARRIALIYAACAALWIYTSDRLLQMLFSDPELLTRAQSLKGWGFVVLTAVLLFWLLQREFKARARLTTDERTARTEAEAARQRLANTLERVSDGFIALDDAWRYTYLNEKAAQLLGRRREDLLGKHIWTEFPDAIGQPFYHAYHKARAEQTPQFIEEYSPPFERWYENRIYPAADGLSIFFQDVTARKQAEAALHESEAGLQLRLTMLKSLYVGAQALAHSQDVRQVSEIVTRTCVQTFGAQLAWVGSADADGRVQRLAHYPVDVDYLRTLQVRWDATPQGYGPVGQSIRAGVAVVVSDIDADPAFQPWRGAAQAQGYRCCAAFPLLSRERALGALTLYSDQPGFFTPERIEFFQTFAQLAGAALENARLFQQVQQHTDELEQHVAERTAQLTEANSALEAFAYSIAHDLRAPLRAMQGFSQALIEDYAPQLDAIARDYVRRIDRAARRMDELVRDILSYCRLDRAEITAQPLALEQAIDEALRLQEEALRSSAAEVSVQRPLPVVLGHYATLVQVLSNLLSNAIKFMAPGVRPVLRFTVELRPGWVRLYLADNGLGIAADHQERIFKIFERLHGVETYPGTGIGLAIVQKALTRMGGRVGVESMPDAGSRFWIELPAPRSSDERELQHHSAGRG